MFNKDADEVKLIMDFVTFKIIWLKVIVTNRAIASLFPIFTLFIVKSFLIKQNIPTYYLPICRKYTFIY